MVQNDLSVFKHDNTTVSVFKAIIGASMDGVPALWRQSAGQPTALPVSMQPTFAVATKANGKGNARQAIFNGVFPFYTEIAPGVYETKSKAVFSGIWTMPNDVSIAFQEDATWQMLNLLGHIETKTMVALGYAAR